MATGRTVGQTTIVAQQGEVSGQAALAVTSVPVPVVTLNTIDVTAVDSSIPTGQTSQFTATGNYSDGSTANLTTTVSWTPVDSSVATIDSNGLATARGDGATSIMATLGAKSGSANLTVTHELGTTTTTTTGTTSLTITLTSPALEAGGVSVATTVEFSNLTGSVDQKAIKDNPTASSVVDISIPSPTTTANELVIAGFIAVNGGGAIPGGDFVASNGFTALNPVSVFGASQGMQVNLVYQNVTTTGNFTASGTYDTSVLWSALIKTLP